MSQRKCPKCGKVIDETMEAAGPFCSKRCREVDLYGWLAEQYPVPVETQRVAEEAIVQRPIEDESSDEFHPSWN
jgi:endogenous inhibitor of DNA gyrase (YacG/DUF329 family)